MGRTRDGSSDRAKGCVLFLPGRYTDKSLAYYQSLCKGRLMVAVDAGFRFFDKVDIAPDVLLGDFDSLRHIPKQLPRKTTVVEFPSAKDKTDTHLGLEYCLERKAPQIDIVQPSIGEPDHFVCNLMLLSDIVPTSGKYRPEVRILSSTCEVRLLCDGALRIDQAWGDRVSVIPISERMTYTCRGTVFDVTDIRVLRGETIAARNRIAGERAEFSVDGKAWVFRRYRSARR